MQDNLPCQFPTMRDILSTFTNEERKANTVIATQYPIADKQETYVYFKPTENSDMYIFLYSQLGLAA
jgi:hypothetical protein